MGKKLSDEMRKKYGKKDSSKEHNKERKLAQEGLTRRDAEAKMSKRQTRYDGPNA